MNAFFFSMDFLYHLLSRIDVGLFCGLGLSQIFFLQINFSSKFFWDFFLFESRKNNFFFFIFLFEVVPKFFKG